MMNIDAKIHVLGARGMVGSAIVRELKKLGYTNINTPTSQELNLTRQDEVENYFQSFKPKFVFMAAAKVGGIYANNTYRAEFIVDNTLMATNVAKSSHDTKVKRLQFLGSSCIYPKHATQPIKEEYLLTGKLEQTNEPYALAKITGLKIIENYRRQYGDDFHSLMPTNLYGVGDNYHSENSHVIPGLIRRMYETTQKGEDVFTAWGSGNPMREFLYVDDLAKACIHIMNLQKIDFDWINIGTGKDITIRELVQLIAKIFNFNGNLNFDNSKPDGTPRKVLDVSKVNKIGWYASTSLIDGLKLAIEDFKQQNSLD